MCLEYEASVHKKLGDMATASSLKAAANLALDCIEHWLDIAPDQHIKNYYPNNSRIGCEKYAYYDKYMVTIASFLYLAYRFCDDTIAASSCPASDDSCHTWQSSDAFRKLFCKAGPYFVEAELRSDPNYDAAGIGRVHRRGAPSAICLSVPVSVRPKYCSGFDNDAPLSICCGKEADGHWLYGFDNDSFFAVLSHRASSECAIAELICTLSNGEQLKQTIKVSRDGVDIELTGDGLIGLTLPVFDFDGAARTSIDLCGKALMVNYKGWQCRYSTNGNIRDLQLASTNRNGVYRIFRAQANDRLILHISIHPNI